MSNSIDEKVVKLTFDNEKFAEKIKETMTMLENLKSKLKLDKAAGSFNEIQKAADNFNMDGMGDAIDQISSRFSTFGIVGTTAIANITTFAMQKGKQLLSALTGPIIEGGKRRALNIEQAKFQIEGLGYTWESVQEDINFAVLDTAYGLDSAAKACGQLLASSVQVGPEMQRALRGISGVAAMTNSEYDDIARVFTTIAGNGRLMGDQLNQLGARGINAASTLAKYLGVTESEVRQMTSKGQIDFATFAAAMDDAFGEHAKEANRTFTGALSNMKAALSRIGAAFATPAYENLRTVILSLTTVFKGFLGALKPVIATAEEAMKVVSTFINSLVPQEKNGHEKITKALVEPMEKFNKALIGLGKVITNVATAFSRILYPIFRAFGDALGGTLLDIIVRVCEGLGELTSQLIISESMSEDIYKTFRGIFTVLAAVADIVTKVAGLIGGTLFTVIVKTFGFFLEILLKITAFIGDAIMVVKSFIDSLLALQSVQDLINLITGAFNRLKDALGDAYTGFRRLAVGMLSKTFETALIIFNKLAEALLFVADFIDRVIQKAKELVHAFMELPAVQQMAEKLTRAFEHLRAIVQRVAPIIKNTLVTAFNNFVDTAGKVIDKIKELIDQYVQLPTFEEAMNSLQQFMTDIFEGGKNVFEVIGQILDRIRELTHSSFTTIAENFVSLGNKVLDVLKVTDRLKELENGFKGVQKGLGDFANSTGQTVDGVRDKLNAFVSWLETKFSNISLGDLIASGAGASLMVFMFSMTRFLGQVGKIAEKSAYFIESIAKVPRKLAKMFEEIGELAHAKATEVKLNAISNLIKSVAILAAAIAALAMMDQDKVMQSAIIIGVLAAALVIISAAATRISNEVNAAAVAKSVGSMVGVAGAMILLCLSLKILGSIPIENLAGAVTALGILMTELVIFVAALNKFAPEMKMGIQSVLAVSIALLVLSQALKNIGKMDAGDLAKSMAVVTSLMIFLTMLAKVQTAGTWQSALGIVGIAVAVKIIISSLEDLAKMDAATYNAGILRTIELMGAIAALLVATLFAGEFAMQAGVAIVLIGASLLMIVQAIKQLGDMEQANITKATDAIKQMIIILSFMVVATNVAGQYAARAGVTIGAAAASMLLLAGAMAILAKIEPEGLQRALDAVSQIIALFAFLVAATQVCTQAEKVIVTMGVVAAALAGALAILSLIEPTNLTAASNAITQLIVAFGLLIFASGFAKLVSPKIFIIVGVVELLALIITQLSMINAEKALVSTKALTTLLLSIAVIMPLLAIFGLVEVAVLPGLLAFMEVIGVIAGIMLALGALNTLVPGLKDVLNNAIPILEAIGNGIGAFVGSIAGGFLDRVTTSLVPFAEAIGKFAEAIKGFIDNSKNLDQSAINSLDKIASLVSVLTSLDYSNVSKIGRLALVLPPLAESLSAFADAIDDNKVDKIHKSAEAAKFLAEMLSYLPDGSIFSSMPDLKGFGDELVKFAESLNSFGSQLKTSSIEKIGSAVEPAKALVDIVNSIANINDEGSGFGNKMYHLSKNLGWFGTCLTEYGNNVSGLQADKVKNSIEPARSLIELANMIGKAGGMIDAFEGTNAAGMAGFSGNLQKFGEALTNYGIAVKGLEVKAINDSVGPAKALVEIFKSLNAEQGMINWFAGSTDIASKGFIENVTNLGEALKKFGESTAAMPTDGLDKALSLTNTLVAVAKEFGPEGGLASWVDGSQGLGFASFNRNVSFLGAALWGFSTWISHMESGDFDTALKIANALSEIYRSLGGSGGAMSFITGDKNNSFRSLALNAPGLGKAIAGFATKIGEMPDVSGKVDSAIQIAKGITECFNGIMPTGGIGSVFVGSKNVSFVSLATNAKALGDGVREFASAITGIGDAVGNVNAAIEIAKGLVTIYNSLEKADLTGPNKANSLAQLGSSLPDFAINIKTFAENLAGVGENATAVDYSSIKTLVENLKGFKEVVEPLKSADLGKTGEGLITFANGYKNLGDKVNEINFDNVQSAVYWLKELAQTTLEFKDYDTSGVEKLADALKEAANLATNGVIDAFNSQGETLKETAVNTISNALSECINTVSSYNDQFKTAGEGALTAFSEGFSETTSGISATAEAMVKAVTSAISNAAESLTNAGIAIALYIAAGLSSSQGVVDSAITTIVNAASALANVLVAIQFVAVGANLMTAMAKGVSSNVGKVKSALSSVAKGIDLYSDGYHIGYWLIVGLQKGIEETSSQAVNAAKRVAEDVIKIMRNVPIVKSPSRVTTQIGKYITQGLANGIIALKALAVGNAGEVSEGVIDVMSDTLSNIADIMTIDDTYTPTITPVLDVSSMEETMTAFNRSVKAPEMNLTGSYNSLGLAFGQLTNQNSQNYMILDKMDKMLDKLQNGSKSGPTVIIDGVTINDNLAMRQATHDYLVELSRLGAM